MHIYPVSIDSNPDGTTSRRNVDDADTTIPLSTERHVSATSVLYP